MRFNFQRSFSFYWLYWHSCDKNITPQKLKIGNRKCCYRLDIRCLKMFSLHLFSGEITLPAWVTRHKTNKIGQTLFSVSWKLFYIWNNMPAVFFSVWASDWYSEGNHVWERVCEWSNQRQSLWTCIGQNMLLCWTGWPDIRSRIHGQRRWWCKSQDPWVKYLIAKSDQIGRWWE